MKLIRKVFQDGKMHGNYKFSLSITQELIDLIRKSDAQLIRQDKMPVVRVVSVKEVNLSGTRIQQEYETTEEIKMAFTLDEAVSHIMFQMRTSKKSRMLQTGPWYSIIVQNDGVPICVISFRLNLEDGICRIKEDPIGSKFHRFSFFLATKE